MNRQKPLRATMPLPLRLSEAGTERSQAFTLVELLVVIAIISILASMLLPALSGAMSAARIAACQNKFRQIFLGANLYADDYDGRYPNLNQSGYLNLGFARPHTGTYWGAESNWNDSLANGAFTAGFCKSYLDADWGAKLERYSPTPQKAHVPDLLLCPGLERGVDYYQAFTPGGLADARYQIGEHVNYGGFFVGYASFLGHYKTPANGQGNTRFMPRRLIDRPADEPLILDALICRILSGNTPDGKMTVPHGSAPKPDGLNQTFADGSTRWIPLGSCNKVYKAAYPWARKVLTPFYLPPDSKMLTDGYGPRNWTGSSANWPLFPTSGWYGLNGYLGNWPP